MVWYWIDNYLTSTGITSNEIILNSIIDYVYNIECPFKVITIKNMHLLKKKKKKKKRWMMGFKPKTF